MTLLKESDVTSTTEFYANRDDAGFVTSLAHERQNHLSVKVTRMQFNSFTVLLENGAKYDARHLAKHLAEIKQTTI